MPQFVEYIRQFGHFQRNARLYLLANALTGISSGIILVLYNLYLSALGYETKFIGFVLFITTLGAGIAIFPAGLCIDRFSGKTILIWSTVLIAIAGAGQILFRSPVPLCVSAFVVGTGIAFQFVLNAPFLTANGTLAERAHLFSFNIVILLITTVLGELLGGALPLWLREHTWSMLPLPSALSLVLASQPLARSYQITLLLAGLIATPGFIPLFLMTNDRPARVRSEQQRSGPFGEQVHRLLSFPLQIAWRFQDWYRQGKAALIGRETTWQRLHRFLVSPLAILIGVNALIGFGAGMLLPYFNLFFVQHLGATSALFGVIDGAANALNAFSTLLAPWLAMRIGRVRTMIFPPLLGIPIMLCIGISSILPLAAILYPLRKGLSDMPMGILQVFSMEVIQPQRRGLANSSYQSANLVAWAVGTPIGGILISRLGYTSVFFATAVLYLLALSLIWWRFGSKGV